jgi:signal transduction histidine kinase
MFDSTLTMTSTDMQVLDLISDVEFMSRRVRRRDPSVEVAAMKRLAHIFVQSRQQILQELVEVAVDICSADSAGISLEESTGDNETQFRWIATAGDYLPFLGAVLPRFHSPCGTCLQRDEPQLIRVPKAYLDTIGVDAPPVTDGILIPWRVDETRGTIWVVAHGEYQHFDREDYRLMQNLSEFAAIAVRHQDQQAELMNQATTAAVAAMANRLAHQINNPLQGVMQSMFLAGQGGIDADLFARQAMRDLTGLSQLVKELLSPSKAG